MEILFGLLFWIALVGATSTYVTQGKRWWGTRGYRVRIVRRNCWIGFGAAFALLRAIYLPENEPPNLSQPSPTASVPAQEPVGGPKPTAAAAMHAPASPAPEAKAISTPLPGSSVQPTVDAEEAAEEAYDAPNALQCGAERWTVKTLSDPDAAKVNFKPVPATIGELAAMPPPKVYLSPDRRFPPVELTTYVVKARLIEYKREHDDDFHLVIADPADRSKTMIAEIAAPGCSDKGQALLGPARREFVHIFGHVSKSWSWSSPPPGADLVEVTGVGFFDFDHGQNGVAPNAIELHPVLGIRRVE